MADNNSILFDQDGFLINPAHWDPILAEQLAELDGLGKLSAEQWRVIQILRRLYNRYHSPLPLRRVCHEGHWQDHHCIEHLFARRPREAWRLAGLPNPGEEAKAYL